MSDVSIRLYGRTLIKTTNARSRPIEAGRNVAHSFRQIRSKVNLTITIILIIGAMNNTFHIGVCLLCWCRFTTRIDGLKTLTPRRRRRLLKTRTISLSHTFRTVRYERNYKKGTCLACGDYVGLLRHFISSSGYWANL